MLGRQPFSSYWFAVLEMARHIYTFQPFSTLTTSMLFAKTWFVELQRVKHCLARNWRLVDFCQADFRFGSRMFQVNTRSYTVFQLGKIRPFLLGLNIYCICQKCVQPQLLAKIWLTACNHWFSTWAYRCPCQAQKSPCQGSIHDEGHGIPFADLAAKCLILL